MGPSPYRPAPPVNGCGATHAATSLPADASAFRVQQAEAWFKRVPPDESLYSALARYHELSGNNRPESTSATMLGHRAGHGMTDTPAGLGWLEQATGGAMSATETTLRERSVWGAYLSLMPSERRKTTLALCSGSDVAKAKVETGLVFNRVASRHPLRLCMACRADQQKRLGFAYWRSPDQWPGRWLCRKHGVPLWYVPQGKAQPRHWQSVEACVKAGTLRCADLPDGQLPLLGRIGATMDWLAKSATLNPELLQIVVRERLVLGGFLRNEVSCSRAEYVSIHARLTEPLAGAEVPDFTGFTDGRWVRQVLIDRRNAHPLRWAVLLAAAGAVEHEALDRAYHHAASRCPQASLFDPDQFHRRARAPAHIYDALTGPVTVNEAASCAGLRPSELRVWLRRDAALVAHRRQTAEAVRLRAACSTIEGYCRENPRAFRFEVIQGCLWAVRWLEVHDRALLHMLLPPVVPMFDRQLRFDFEGSALIGSSRTPLYSIL